MNIFEHTTLKVVVVAVFAAMCMVWLAGAIAVCGRTKLHPESAHYLLHYTGPKTLLQKIYDPKNTDMNSYQAREFSYLADWANYNAVFKSAALFGPNFQSPMHYLFSLGMAAVMFCLGGYSWTALLCAGVFLFSPNIFFSLWIFRTAKVLTGFFFVALGVFALHTVRNGAEPRRLFVLSFVAGFLMSVSDMQGYAMLMLLTAVSGAYILLAKDKRLVPMLKGLCFALFWRVVYDKLMADTFVNYFGGYTLDRHYVSIKIIPALLSPENWASGFNLWLGTIGYFAGNISRLPSLLLVCAAPFYFLWRYKSAVDEIDKRLSLLGLLFTLLLFCMIPATTIMVARHPPLANMTLLYYWIPETAVLYILLHQICAAVSSRNGRLVTNGLLAVMLMMNVALLLKLKNIDWEPEPGLHNSAKLFACIADRGKTVSRLPVPYALVCLQYVNEPNPHDGK